MLVLVTRNVYEVKCTVFWNKLIIIFFKEKEKKIEDFPWWPLSRQRLVEARHALLACKATWVIGVFYSLSSHNPYNPYLWRDVLLVCSHWLWKRACRSCFNLEDINFRVARRWLCREGRISESQRPAASLLRTSFYRSFAIVQIISTDSYRAYVGIPGLDIQLSIFQQTSNHYQNGNTTYHRQDGNERELWQIFFLSLTMYCCPSYNLPKELTVLIISKWLSYT